MGSGLQPGGLKQALDANIRVIRGVEIPHPEGFLRHSVHGLCRGGSCVSHGMLDGRMFPGWLGTGLRLALGDRKKDFGKLIQVK